MSAPMALVVDDSRLARELLRRHLETAGIDVVEAARNAAQRLSSTAGDAPVRAGSSGVAISITTSIGVACGDEAAGPSPAEKLLSLADSRLYEAKAAGRCCVKP